MSDGGLLGYALCQFADVCTADVAAFLLSSNAQSLLCASAADDLPLFCVGDAGDCVGVRR